MARCQPLPRDSPYQALWQSHKTARTAPGTLNPSVAPSSSWRQSPSGTSRLKKWSLGCCPWFRPQPRILSTCGPKILTCRSAVCKLTGTCCWSTQFLSPTSIRFACSACFKPFSPCASCISSACKSSRSLFGCLLPRCRSLMRPIFPCHYCHIVSYDSHWFPLPRNTPKSLSNWNELFLLTSNCSLSPVISEAKSWIRWSISSQLYHSLRYLIGNLWLSTFPHQTHHLFRWRLRVFG